MRPKSTGTATGRTFGYHDNGSIELRAYSETVATFDSPEAVFEDANAYPATETDIKDARRVEQDQGV